MPRSMHKEWKVAAFYNNQEAIDSFKSAISKIDCPINFVGSATKREDVLLVCIDTQPDVIILPFEFGGYELITQIMTEITDIMIIKISHNYQDESSEKDIRQGLAATIMAPFRTEELDSVIRGVINGLSYDEISCVFR